MSVTTEPARQRTAPPPRPGRVAAGVSRPIRRVWRYVRVLVPAAALWYLLAIATDNPLTLPSPVPVAQALGDLFSGGALLSSAGASLTRLAIGYAAAVVVCVPLGIAMGLSSTVRFLVDPIIEILRPISGIAWIPLALILFGVGNSIVIFIIFYGAAFPLIINTIAGIREVDENLVNAARTFGASRMAIVVNVVLPGALPTILVGARIAAGTAWMSLVAAELVGASSGLGFSIQYYRSLLMTSNMIGFVVVIGFLGLLTNVVLLGLQRWLTPWAMDQRASTR